MNLQVYELHQKPNEILPLKAITLNGMIDVTFIAFLMSNTFSFNVMNTLPEKKPDNCINNKEYSNSIQWSPKRRTFEY